MHATLESAAQPHVNVNGRQAPQRLVGACGPKELGRRIIVRHDEQDIVIAVRPSFASGHGAEQIDPLRVINAHEPLDYLGEDLIRFVNC